MNIRNWINCLVLILTTTACQKAGEMVQSFSRSPRAGRTLIQGVDNSTRLCQKDLFTNIEYCTTQPVVTDVSVFDDTGHIRQVTTEFGTQANVIEVTGDFSSANPAGETDYGKMLYTAVAYNGGNAVIGGITIGYCVPIVTYESPTLIRIQVPVWDYNTSCEYFISHKYVNAARTGTFNPGPLFKISSAVNLGRGDDTRDPVTNYLRDSRYTYVRFDGVYRNLAASGSKIAVTYSCDKSGTPLVGAFSVVPGSVTENQMVIPMVPEVEGASCRFGLYDQFARPYRTLMDINWDFSSVGINPRVSIGAPVQVPPEVQPELTPTVSLAEYAGIDPVANRAYIVLIGNNLASGTPAMTGVTMTCDQAGTVPVDTEHSTYVLVHPNQVNIAFDPVEENNICEVVVSVQGKTTKARVMIGASH